MESDIRYWIDQGKEFFKSKAYKKAEEVFQKVVAQKNEFADVYNMLGIIHHENGQFTDAIDSFKRALKINPHYTEAMMNLSVLLNDLGEYKAAKDLLGKFKKESKKSSDAIDPYVKAKLANKHAEVGDLYRSAGLFARAVDEYERALELSPTFNDIRNKMGICLRELGKKNEALKEFQKIIKEKPQYLDAQIQVGLTLFALGKKKEAKTQWEKLAKANPSNTLIRTYLKLSDGAGTPGKRK